MYDCKAIRPPPIREVVVAPWGRATWLEELDALLTVAGQRRTFTGFAFKPLIREGWHPKGLFNCHDCICGQVECQEKRCPSSSGQNEQGNLAVGNAGQSHHNEQKYFIFP